MLIGLGSRTVSYISLIIPNNEARIDSRRVHRRDIFMLNPLYFYCNQPAVLLFQLTRIGMGEKKSPTRKPTTLPPNPISTNSVSPSRAATTGPRPSAVHRHCRPTPRVHPYQTCLHPCCFPPPATIKAGSAPSPTHLSPPLPLPLSIGRPTPSSQRRLLHPVPARSPPEIGRAHV